MTNLQLLKSYGEVKKKKYKNCTVYYHASIEDPKREKRRNFRRVDRKRVL